MRFAVLTVLALVAVCAAASDDIKRAPLLAADSPTAVEGEYIVVLKEELADQDVSDHKSVVRNLMGFHNSSKILNEYSIGKGFRGYSARMTDKLRDTVLAMNHVKYMERNQEAHALGVPCINQKQATWGIVRTIHDEKPSFGDTDFDYDDEAAGEGVDVYIIDTGIFSDHQDFGGRAKQGADFIDTPANGGDPNGHGTHCAGTVMSNTWGLARKSTAIAVRVLNAGGSGSYDQVIAGVNYVANQHSSTKKSVANMSLGGGFSATLNAAVNAAVDEGVHFSLAAGNEGQNACNVSPASAEKAVTVCASDSSDMWASFSNWGECTDIIAPGVSVTSTWNNGGTNTISGTSMSAPHVAGVMAKMLSEEKFSSLTPEEMRDQLKENSSKDRISNVRNPTTTDNHLVFHACPDVTSEHVLG